MVRLERELHPELRLNFTNTKPDYHILNTAHHVSKEQPSRQVRVRR
jgi:hypothetical protein